MRLFSLAFLSLLLLASPALADDRVGDFDPNGLVAGCEGVAGVVVQVAQEAGVSLGEAWRVVDPGGACLRDGYPQGDFGPVIVVSGFGPVIVVSGVTDDDGALGEGDPEFGPVIVVSG